MKHFDELKKRLANSYACYSNFQVSACVETDQGVFYGNNIENSSFGLSMCAERVAIFNAITNKAKKFYQLELVSSDNELCLPCGACLQVMSEFFDQDTKIICYSNDHKQEKTFTLKDLLPCLFKNENLKK